MGRRKTSSPGGLAAFAILAVVCLILFTVYVKEDPDSGPLHTVQLGAMEVLRPVHGVVGALAWPFQTVGGYVQGAFGAAEREAQLEEELMRYREQAAENARLVQENQRLREMLDGQRAGYEYSPLARVIAPVGGQFANRIVINVGSEDGVKPEQPVVVGNNTLVGRTTERVTPNTAEVMLITDQAFAAGVTTVPPASFDRSTGEVQPPEDEGVVYGEGLLQTSWEGSLGIDYVELSDRVEKDDYVITSGRAGERELLFPPGLFVGTVASVSSQDLDQYKKIVVSPAVNPDALREVRVIIDW
ncbi:rod shape-determining protein MreC [Rubrobacter taiwanensis]|jgi:rod shape-determining protein MreC|uniref:Cell shape-determining protein MreC n=1 Tax=Rubrobacter taiwanensis TaxID=185139 RepID=A0A4V2NWG8_9ACTN|nr:rod shape-determining protein MreC [Rubrobacter taiwanensis]TCJ17332.1 rod shape-determining protein MreC [Rubrobacter taiwanensis]